MKIPQNKALRSRLTTLLSALSRSDPPGLSLILLASRLQAQAKAWTVRAFRCIGSKSRGGYSVSLLVCAVVEVEGLGLGHVGCLLQGT